MRQLLRRAWYLLHQRQRDRDLAEEMAFHREMTTRDLESRGVNSGEAADAVWRAFGSTALAADRSRDVWVPQALQGLEHDFRLAARTLRATPIVSAVAVLSLALGIGANTAIFSLVNSLALRPLPVAAPDRLVFVSTGGVADQFWHYSVWEEIRQRPELFENAGAWFSTRFNLSTTVETQLVAGGWASGSYFDMLGVHAVLGRVFTLDDDRVGGGADGPVAIISYGFWQRQFGFAPDAIGRRLSVNGVAVSIVGVTPQNFSGMDVGRTFDVVLPLNNEPLVMGHSLLNAAAGLNVMIVGRLKSGQSLDAATAQLRAVQDEIRERTLPQTPNASSRDPYLRDYLKEPFTLVPAGTGRSNFRAGYVRPLLIVLCAAGLVLFVACANVANLLLARAAAKRHELSVRVALGASRWRLARALLVEGGLLGLAAGALGLLVASWGARLLVQRLSTQINPVFLDLSIDWRLLTFSVALGFATLSIFGVVPALRASQAVPLDAMKHARGAIGDSRGHATEVLVVLQVALSVVLVVGAGLLVRTFVSLLRLDPGFARHEVLLVTVDGKEPVDDPAQRLLVYARVREAVQQTPGVTHAALSEMTPVSNIAFDPPIDVSGGDPLSARERKVFANVVSPQWFATLGIPLVQGRGFQTDDRIGAPPVAIVSQAFARRFLNGADPIGHTITLPALMTAPAPSVPIRIVGVVADAVYLSLREPPRPTMYLPIDQHNEGFFARALASVTVNVRSDGLPPARLAKSVAAAIATVDPRLSVTIRPLSDQVDDSLARERVIAMLAGFFGGVALFLAGLGLYGVTSYAVTRRRSEIGIRLALGAAPARVVGLVLWRVGVLVVVGVLVGAAVSLSSARLLASLVYGLEPRDPATLAGAIITLGSVGLFAGWLPARRASRIDPAVALRAE